MTRKNIYDFNSIKAQISITRYLQEQGMEIRSGNRFNATWRGGEHFSCSFNDVSWCDHANNDKGGSVLDLCMKVEGVATVGDAATVLGDRYRLTPKSGGGSSSKGRKVAQYVYTDDNGNPLYCKVRYEPKSFEYHQINADGSCGRSGMGNQPHVLYRLPEVIKAVKDGARIFIVEGEKDVDNLHALDLTATSSKEWQNNGARFAEQFRGSGTILIIADNDTKHCGHCHGEENAVIVRDALSGVGVASHIAYVGTGKDASDWIEAMRKEKLSDDDIRQKFIDLADNPPEWTYSPPNMADVVNAAEDLPPRFGELLPDSSNKEYPSFIGKAKMPDNHYYPFVVSADDPLYAAILKANIAVITAHMKAHQRENGHKNLQQRDLTEVELMSIVMWLRSLGYFYRNAETQRIEDLMYFNRKSGRLLTLKSDEFSTWVSNGARLNRADRSYQRTVKFIEDAAMDENVSIETIPKAFVARLDDAIYISNGESNIVRCKDGKCELVRNGTDGVLFPCEHTLKKWQLLPDEKQVRDPFDTTMQFNDLAYSEWYCKYLLRAWYLNLFACHANHTPLLLTGDRNSGKSATARAIRAMGGFPTREAGIDPKKEEDFWVAANGKGILFFDNIEEEVMSAKWLPSAIEKVTTGGGKEVRKLYTHTSTNYKATSDIIFASKIPYYAANEGVAHRFVIVNLNASISRYRGDELLKEVLARRDESMTWVARTIAKALVTTISTPINVNERYPDFGEFTLKCATVLDDYENTLKALQCGEFEKSRIVLVNDREANGIYQFLLEKGGAWEGELQEIARWVYADSQPSDSTEETQVSIRNQAMRYAHTIRRLRKPFEVCFKSVSTRTIQGRTRYTFGGFNELIKGNM